LWFDEALDISTKTDKYFYFATPFPFGYIFKRHSTPFSKNGSEYIIPTLSEKL
jgi:hypothetical protein